jgi:hypothetical protein
MNQMLVFTVKRESHTLGRLAHLESKLMRLGAVIQSWDAATVKIAVPDETMMHVGLLLSDNDFHCKA